MTLKRILKIIGNLLLHPGIVFLGIGVGIFIGLTHKTLAVQLGKAGEIYLRLLQMCVLPFMISAVVLSVGNLFRKGKANTYIIRIVTVFLAGMIIASIIGVSIGFIGKPGTHLGKEQKTVLGREIIKFEADSGAKPTVLKNKGLLYFIKEMIPTNVFYSITEGENLPVLFFCIIIGVALGTLRSESSDTVLSAADASYEALMNIISWLMYGLPFGLCCLFANQISQIGVVIFLALIFLVLLLYASSILLMVVYSIIIWLRSGHSFMYSFLAMKGALIIAIGTSSSLASIPFALEGLHKKLKFEKETTGLVIPLGIILNPHGNIVHFALSAIFMSQLYGVSLSLSDFAIIVPMAALAGVAASSAPGIAALSMLALLLEPFGLPVTVGILLLTAIDPIVDPILTAVNVYGNCATASLVAGRNPESAYS